MREDRFTTGFRFVVFLVLLLCNGIGSNRIANAQQPGTNRDTAATQLLAKQFVDAVNHKSLDERKAILHPRSRACIRTQTQPYFDLLFSRQLARVIPSNYVAKSESRSPGFFSPPEAQAEYPVRPTHTLQIDYSSGPFSSTTILLSIIKEGTQWYEVLPCPSPEAVKLMQATEAENKAHGDRARQLVADLAEPLRSDIETLARSGHRLDAVRKYQEASGEDLTVSVSVIDALVPRN